MVAKLSVVVALAMFICYASAQSETTKTVVSSTSTYDGYVAPSGLPLSYYAIDTKAYNDLKKSIYSLNQGLNNICFNAQAAYDYYSLYKNQVVNQLKLDEKLDKFGKAQKLVEDQYQKYQQALNAYKADLALKSVITKEEYPIDSALLL
ncbi:Hypothetical protein CINCED_3A024606 [Cinara cedri]|uniref:Uncharacterized protein n=1 Tax=Cinara cedri TaxID=506608 RepID=A0A5E4LXK3_9HEMI|nr:Hypothetical protein CINCED_3A024606 [Cinara cedri]